MLSPDQLPEKCDRKQALSFFVFLLEDDLREDRARYVFAGLGVVHNEILAIFDHGGEVLERHVSACSGIVEPPVGIFFYRDRLFFIL
jgi:hypothetical protein